MSEIPWWTFPFAVGGTFVAFIGSAIIGFSLEAMPMSNDLKGALAITAGVLMALVFIGAIFALALLTRGSE